GKGGGPGSHSQITFPKPLDLLNSDLHQDRAVPVLTYRTTDSAPPYLQVYVLDNLTTNAWTMGRPPAAQDLSPRGLPAVPGLAGTPPGPGLQETITRGPTLAKSGNASSLPLPYPARKVGIEGDWRVDQNTLSVLSPSAQLAGRHYSVVAKDVNPTPDQL